MDDRKQFYIGGRWIAPAGTGTIAVHCPADGSLLAHIPDGSAEDADAAVRAARAAFDGWSATAPHQRADYLGAIQAGLAARSQEIAETITQEMGMPLRLSKIVQAGSPIANFGNYAKILNDFSFEERIGNSQVVREPVGVVVAITPWNYPLHQIAAKVAPALAAGCTVVLKPSEVAPFDAFILAEVIDKIGLPPGVFNLVTGFGPTLGEALVAHPQADMVSFTGSTRAGVRVSQLAAGTVKRVALELGGKSAAIILEDADFLSAVKGVVANCFLNSGQTCTAHTRMLVPQGRYQEAAELAKRFAGAYLPGNPTVPETKLGPLASEQQLERVRGYIGKGIEAGAELICGGIEPPEGVDPGGYYVAPTVFGRVDPDCTIAQEEIFGPVLSIISYHDEDEAVRIANGVTYGLSGGVWSGSEQSALRVARRLRTGQVDINGAPFNINAPFGGYKQSGNGRELGVYGLEEFLEYKAIQLPPPPKS